MMDKVRKPSISVHSQILSKTIDRETHGTVSHVGTLRHTDKDAEANKSTQR
jgi:hypothetical protein